MSIAKDQAILWSDIKKLYTDAYDTGRMYNGHKNYLRYYGPKAATNISPSTYPREDSSWAAGQKAIPEHVNRIIRAHNARAGVVSYKKAYNNYTTATVPEVAQNNLIKASDLSALRTYFTNALNYSPCNCNSGGGSDSDCNNSCDSCMDCDCHCK